jgi:DNA-binding transcriptional MerR regulator
LNVAARYFTTAEVASRYRTAQSTVRFWRHRGYGPKGVKVGRRVLYSEVELERFEQALAAKVQTVKETA